MPESSTCLIKEIRSLGIDIELESEYHQLPCLEGGKKIRPSDTAEEFRLEDFIELASSPRDRLKSFDSPSIGLASRR